jgi:glucosamine--fructose-6-phosphate aminotransferase (isomerizing)
MCGIVGYVGNKNSVDVLLDGLEKLEYRGYDSAGIAIYQNGFINTIKSKGRLNQLKDKMNAFDEFKSNCGIGHTRWATHGEPSDVNSHPHGSNKIAIVHNGIIENYVEIKRNLINKGIKFISQTDTETVVRLLEYYYNADPISTIKKVVSKIKGSYALAIIFNDFPDKIYALRKDSPLMIGIGENENFIASDIPAILTYTRQYYLLEQDEIAVLSAEKIDIVDEWGMSISKDIFIANWDIEAAQKGGYPHFMLKEIYEQPKAVKDTITTLIKDELPNLNIERLTDERLNNIKSIYIVGCGTAMHAGMIGKNAIEGLAKTRVEVDVASEFRYRNPILNPDDLVIIISQSGETADTLAALRLAKSQGVQTLAIVNVVGSSIAREADDVIYTLAGPEIAVASTKAYSVQMAVMYLLAIKLALVKNQIDECKGKMLCRDILKIPEIISEYLKNSDECKYFASKFQNSHSLFFIGRGIDYALSQEGSLKLKEISYIHSEAYPAGELKHGTISLIDDDVPVIAIATQKNLFEKMISNIREVKTRGAKVLILCHSSLEIDEDIADYCIKLPIINDLFMPLLAVVPLQLFAYYTAVLRGCDVDKPKNLAKSVTVE